VQASIDRDGGHGGGAVVGHLHGAVPLADIPIQAAPHEVEQHAACCRDLHAVCRSAQPGSKEVERASLCC